MTSDGVVMTWLAPLRDVAKGWQVTHRCAKRRLLRYHEQIIRQTDGRHHLLRRSSDRSHIFVDMAVAKRFLPGLVSGDGEDPAVVAVKKLVELEEKVNEVLMRLSA